MNKRPPPAVDLARLDPKQPDAANRLLLEWLSDDVLRSRLFEAVNANGGAQVFPSRDAQPRQCDGQGYDVRHKPAVPGHADITLVTSRARIEEILEDKVNYSNRVYAELGGGQFMLALDPGHSAAHAAQRAVFGSCFPRSGKQVPALAHAACRAAAVMAFRADEFDLASYAEQAAVRFCMLLMGYAVTDYRLLETALRAAYRALVYQVMERHFVTDPVLIPEAKAAAARLMARTSALIEAYHTEDEDLLKGTSDPAQAGFTPVLKCLAKQGLELNGEQRATLAVGTAVGSVGNVQAAACIAVEGLFGCSAARQQAHDLARTESATRPTEKATEWMKLITPFLRANPPIPYLPRLKVRPDGTKERELLLALGGGTATWTGTADADDPLVWGLESTGVHWCVGKGLAWPLIVEVVRQVMALPNLAQALDPVDGLPKGLKKRHGFACESYPLTHRRDRCRAQSSLNVVMRIKAPVKDNADHVREVINAGAPRIERLLRESRHVHFAWFELVESDSVLVLHTVYDGPFGAYLQHFAQQAGDLFDALFEYIEDPPPMPVAKFPQEFAAHLQRYNRPPLRGYFFSAYPGAEVAQILRREERGQ